MNTAFKRLIAPLWVRLGQAKVRRLTDPPIIIGGCARSGTTLLTSILSAHPHIWMIPRETGTFAAWDRAADGTERPRRLDRFAREILFHRIPPTARRWGEKSPLNIAYVPQILRYFDEQVRIIHIVRDVRDVCLSIHPSRPGSYWVEPSRWLHDVQAGLAYKDHPRVHTLTYETLVTDNAGAIGRIMEFLGEPLCAEVVDWYAHARKRSDRALGGSLQPLSAAALGKWREPRHAARVAEVERCPGVRALLDTLGYP